MIVGGEIRPFRLRLRRSLENAKGEIRHREGVLLALRDSDGRVGFGEATPVPGFGRETAAASAEALKRLLSIARGRRVRDARDLLARAADATPDAPAARFALDTALCDLAARASGRTLADWLAGGRAPRRAVPVNALLSGDDPEAVAEAARSAVAEGFRVFKLKVGMCDLGIDLERVAALRQVVGPCGRIRLDANGAWPLELAHEALRALAVFDVEYLEEPVTVRSAADVAPLRQLKDSSMIALAADECLALPSVVGRVLALRAVDTLILKPAVLGGLQAARDLALRARDAGIDVVVTSGLDAAVGLAASLHLAASLEGELPECGLATADWLAEDLAAPLRPQNGILALPDSLGLGVAPDAVETPWLVDRAATTPDAPSLRLAQRTLTWAELEREARGRWSVLRSYGVERGDVVAMWLGSFELATVFHAAMLGGAVVLPLNLRLSDPEVAFQLRDSGARWLLQGSLTRRLEAPAGVRSIDLGESRPDESVGLAPLDPARPLAILYTSGTTGRPKGAVLTAANFRASARGSSQLLGSASSDLSLACMPLFHVGGLSILVRALLVGSSVEVHEGFDPEAVARAFDRHPITDVSFVAHMLARVLDTRGDKPAPKSLQNVLVGGGPVPGSLLGRARALGYPVAPTYGLTEATSQVATRSPRDVEAKGLRALPGVEIRVDALPGEAGEIQVRGPTVMRGYWNRPEETARALQGGWLHTGDVGVMHEDGTLSVLDRRSDLIVSGGENVYPAEVEAALLEHPCVAEAGVGYRGDAHHGARPVAWWVPVSADAPVAEGELRSFCRNRLAPFKVPVRFYRVAALPRTPEGKLVRSRLQVG